MSTDQAPVESGHPGPPKPGPQHQSLHRFAGTFRAEVRIYMGPGEPMISTGTMRNTSEIDGLYLRQDYRGDSSDGPFPDFLGQGYWGYNQTLSQFEGFWIDNASTTMQLEYGQVDDSGNRWEMRSEFIPAAGQKPIRKRTVIQWVDHDHHTMQSWFQAPGAPEFLSMEISYRRQA